RARDRLKRVSWLENGELGQCPPRRSHRSCVPQVSVWQTLTSELTSSGILKVPSVLYCIAVFKGEQAIEKGIVPTAICPVRLPMATVEGKRQMIEQFLLGFIE